MKTLKQQLEQYQNQAVTPMHMPGHKRNPKTAAYLHNISEQWDITEIEGFDNLHNANGILKESMEHAAKTWGSDHAYFLVNGSTCGILAGIRASTKRGDRVLVARNCHKAVFHAIELCGLVPVFVLPTFMENDLFGSVRPQKIEQKIQEFPDIKLIILTSPTYEGVLTDIASVCQIAHRREIPVFVDEAHGAHLGFFDYFPDGAVKAGADVVVQSLHKTLPSLTQTAILHTNGHRICQERFKHQLAVFETSSPSYLFLMSIDECVRHLQKEHFAKWATLLEQFYQKAKTFRNLSVLQQTTGQFMRDRSKIVILSENGFQVGQELRKRKIEPEFVTPSYVLAMTGMGDTEKTLTALFDALTEIDRIPCKKIQKQSFVPSCPQLKQLPEQALQSDFELISPQNAKHRISAEYIWAYPPGIPLLIPGEQIETIPEGLLYSTRGHLPETIAVLKEQS